MRDLDANEQSAYMKNLRERRVTINSTPKLTIKELHKQFEEWFANEYEGGEAERHGKGYLDDDIDLRWNVWLASARQNGVIK